MAGHVNSSWNMSDDDVYFALRHSCNLYSFIVYTVIIGMLVVVGVTGNSFAFVVFWKDDIKTSTSFLFQGLSLIDSTLLLTAIPLYSIQSFVDYTGWLQGYGAIEAYIFVYVLPLSRTAHAASIWVTVLIAVNRYIAVCIPYKASRLCTVLKAKKQLAVVLLLAVLYNIPAFTKYRVAYTADNGTTYPTVARNWKFASEKLYGTFSILFFISHLIFLLALPILILAVLTIRLIKALKAFRRKRMEIQSLRQQQDNSVTLVLIIVVIVFIICQVPALVNHVILVMAPIEAISCGHFFSYLEHIANMLIILNSAVNFVIYALFNKRFRYVLTQTVCRWCVLTDDRQNCKSTDRSPGTAVTNRVMDSPEKENDNSVENTRF
ncbi:FMRFamide receptor [Lamellibrachia satsuma]|nr:FMRFamide receptor [Lamellibrachia satsuma]